MNGFQAINHLRFKGQDPYLKLLWFGLVWMFSVENFRTKTRAKYLTKSRAQSMNSLPSRQICNKSEIHWKPNCAHSSRKRRRSLRVLCANTLRNFNSTQAQGATWLRLRNSRKNWPSWPKIASKKGNICCKNSLISPNVAEIYSPQNKLISTDRLLVRVTTVFKMIFAYQHYDHPPSSYQNFDFWPLIVYINRYQWFSISIRGLSLFFAFNSCNHPPRSYQK